MDRRWIGIIIIAIIGIVCGFLVVESSTTVGSAVTIINDVSVTLPHGFKISNSELNEVLLTNEKDNESIFVKYISDGNNSLSEYNKKIKSLNQNGDIEILKNKSNDTVHIIYCHDWNTDKNYSLSYFEKFDRTLLVKMENFESTEKQESDLMYIITTLSPDYKQSRD